MEWYSGILVNINCNKGASLMIVQFFKLENLPDLIGICPSINSLAHLRYFKTTWALTLKFIPFVEDNKACNTSLEMLCLW